MSAGRSDLKWKGRLIKEAESLMSERLVTYSNEEEEHNYLV